MSAVQRCGLPPIKITDDRIDVVRRRGMNILQYGEGVSEPVDVR